MKSILYAVKSHFLIKPVPFVLRNSPLLIVLATLESLYPKSVFLCEHRAGPRHPTDSLFGTTSTKTHFHNGFALY